MGGIVAQPDQSTVRRPSHFLPELLVRLGQPLPAARNRTLGIEPGDPLFDRPDRAPAEVVPEAGDAFAAPVQDLLERTGRAIAEDDMNGRQISPAKGLDGSA